MARVRVFVPTFRRPHLLPRALASLQAQTFTDWCCEVHNDDPADPQPAELVARLADARIRLVQHPGNLGGTASFNLFFRETPEEFISMLEDDNWWEPEFLATMIDAAQKLPAATVIWSNMRIWQEEEDASFRDTGTCIHAYGPADAPRLVPWGSPAQIFGALHSNGAALVRSLPGMDLSTPDVPLASVEIFRERRFRFPLGFVAQPLANFSLTRSTSRSRSRTEWAEIQVMTAASFLKHARYDDEQLAQLLRRARAAQPRQTGPLLLAALVEPSCRGVWRAASPADVWALLRGCVRRPQLLLCVLASRRRHPDWWKFLDMHTANQFVAASPTA